MTLGVELTCLEIVPRSYGASTGKGVLDFFRVLNFGLLNDLDLFDFW